MDCKETTKKENLIYKGRILNLYNDDVILADGSESAREYWSSSLDILIENCYWKYPQVKPIKAKARMTAL